MKITYPNTRDGIIKMMFDDYLWARLGELSSHSEAMNAVLEGVRAANPKPRYEWVAAGLLLLEPGDEWLEAVLAEHLQSTCPKTDGNLDLSQIPEHKRLGMLAKMLS